MKEEDWGLSIKTSECIKDGFPDVGGGTQHIWYYNGFTGV